MQEMFEKCLKNSLPNSKSLKDLYLLQNVGVIIYKYWSIADEYQRSNQKQYPIVDQMKGLYQTVYARKEEKKEMDSEGECKEFEDPDENSDLHSFQGDHNPDDTDEISDVISDDNSDEVTLEGNSLFKSASSHEINSSQVSMSSDEEPLFGSNQISQDMSESSNSDEGSDPQFLNEGDQYEQ
ncbi:unnamed protein product [Moneuplotes crassus]|uniref:Uncharacterized protein n=1 Tax=Euplotes crassus TaxID=5936 RepID=A0AAD2D0K2_EUPCR|nr:unnamed protein product [Moneuplotes crassus]